MLSELVGKVAKIEYFESAPHKFLYSGGNWDFVYVIDCDPSFVKIRVDWLKSDEGVWLNLACVKSLELDEHRTQRYLQSD